MIAVPTQDQIEVSLTDDGVIVITQTDINDRSSSIYVAPNNVPALIAALQDAIKGA